MRERKEFERGPNEDYLPSLFHIIQETGNEHLASLIREQMAREAHVDNPGLVEKYVGDLEQGRVIEGRLSTTHYGIPYANFTKGEIERALAVHAGG